MSPHLFKRYTAYAAHLAVLLCFSLATAACSDDGEPPPPMGGTSGMGGGGGMPGTGGFSGTGGTAGAGGTGGTAGMGGTAGTGGMPGVCDDGTPQDAAGLTAQVTTSAALVPQGDQLTVNVPVNGFTGQVFVDMTNGLFLTGQAMALTNGDETVQVTVTVFNDAELGVSRIDIDLIETPNDFDNRTSYTLSDTTNFFVREVFVDGVGDGGQLSNCVVPEIEIVASDQ